MTRAYFCHGSRHIKNYLNFQKSLPTGRFAHLPVGKCIVTKCNSNKCMQPQKQCCRQLTCLMGLQQNLTSSRNVRHLNNCQVPHRLPLCSTVRMNYLHEYHSFVRLTILSFHPALASAICRIQPAIPYVQPYRSQNLHFLPCCQQRLKNPFPHRPLFLHHIGFQRHAGFQRQA